MRGARLGDRDIVDSRDHGVGQLRRLGQRIEDGLGQADARRLDTHHFAAVPTAQFAGGGGRRGCICRAARADLVEQLRRANQFFGEIRAVLEQIEDVSAQLRIGVQAIQMQRSPPKCAPENVRKI